MKILLRKFCIVHRLAYPSLWWRVTVLCLVICGKAPRLVGAGRLYVLKFASYHL